MKKTYSLSKTELDFLIPVHSVKTGLEASINNYLIGVVIPRLAIDVKPTSKIQYFLQSGEITVEESEPEVKPEVQTKPDVKAVETLKPQEKN